MAIDLLSALDDYFELVHADTDALRMQVYVLRYQVYVLETGFESEEECEVFEAPDGAVFHYERDEYDRRSDHFLLRHRRTGSYAATARLILPDPDDPASLFPMEANCRLDDGKRIIDPETRKRLSEISRFAVSKDFKRRLGESGTQAGVADNVDVYFEPDERRVLPHISLGLFAAVMRMIYQHRLTHSYAVMEPALHRLIGRFGVIFNPIGPQTEYHGKRIPCLGSVDEALPNIKRVAPSVWDLITERGRLLV
ncbi:MAG TPA: PEP-CTERM/exosortase system-associated acyltransferase [Thiobacillaceae bacterium]|nr:PEP-CTERM/exosortase system-associated acyltransferase [Thiobacillaceae bacterium]